MVKELQGPRNCGNIKLTCPELHKIRALKTEHFNFPIVAAHGNACKVGVKRKGFDAVSTAEDL